MKNVLPFKILNWYWYFLYFPNSRQNVHEKKSKIDIKYSKISKYSIHGSGRLPSPSSISRLIWNSQNIQLKNPALSRWQRIPFSARTFCCPLFRLTNYRRSKRYLLMSVPVLNPGSTPVPSLSRTFEQSRGTSDENELFDRCLDVIYHSATMELFRLIVLLCSVLVSRNSWKNDLVAVRDVR